MKNICKSCAREDGLWGDPSPNAAYCRNCIHAITLADNFRAKVGESNERLEYERLKNKFGG